MVLMVEGDESWSSRQFQLAHQISSNSAKMISTSAFLHFAFPICLLTYGGLVVQGMSMLSILHQYASTNGTHVFTNQNLQANFKNPLKIPTTFGMLL